jgi:hypothetical protein
MSFANVLKQFKKTKRKPKSTVGSSMVDNDNTSELTNSLDVMGKNSMALPVIMRDINVMKQGILKLVKIAGGTQKDRADRFFLSASDREKSYESQIASTKSTSPTKIGGDKKDGKGFFGQANNFLNAIIAGGLSNLLIKGGLIAGILYGIGKFFSSSEFRKSVSDMIGNLGKTVFGEEGWKDVKKSIATGAVILLAGIVAVKSALLYLSSMIASTAFGIGGGRGRRGVRGRAGRVGSLANLATIAAGGTLLANSMLGEDGSSSDAVGGTGTMSTGDKLQVGAIAAAGAVSGVTGVSKTIGAVKSTGTAVLDARTMSVGQMANSTPTTKWGKFLKFVAKKSPKLWGKIGLKLAQAGALVAIPLAGWVMAAINLGLAFWSAWELYELWKEFSNMPEENTSPQKISSSGESTGMTGAEAVRQLIGQSGGISLSGGANPDYYGNAGMTPSTSTSPLRMSPSSTSGGGDVDRVLSTIKGVESGGNYNAKNPNSSASGAYQFIDSTWQAATRKYGIGQEYKTARSAPPEIQDMVARKSVEDLLSKYNGDVDKVVNVWYTGNPAGNMTAAGLAANRGLTAEGYRARFEKQYNNSGGSLNQGSRQLSNSQNASSGSPMVINAPTTNMNSGGSSAINLPASGVIDNELAKLLVERAIG